MTLTPLATFQSHKSIYKMVCKCNRPFQSKFYCSENRPTSFMELVEYWAETKTLRKVYATIEGGN